MAGEEKTVDGFQWVSTIAKGNSSQVWEVRDVSGAIFAIKMLLPEYFKDSSEVAVLKHEAKVAQSVEHPNIIRVHRFVKNKTHCYMLMEYFRYPNLKAMLKSEPFAIQSRLPRLVEQLCATLGFMHEKGWLHHDLKPENILFNKAGEMKLIDFSLSMKRKGGLGKMIGGKVKVVQGTRTYIAPETIRKEYPTPQSDMYSLGIMLFEIVTGQPPFVANSPNDLLMKHLNTAPPEPSVLNSNVTPEADKFILRLLSKKPANRPQSMSEVAAEARSIQFFKMDPQELANEEERRKREGGGGLGANSLLDSRADAARTAAGISAPARPEPRKPSARALEMARKAGMTIPKELGGADPTPPAPQEAEQQWQGQWPGYAGHGYQGYWPQQPMPGGASTPPQQGYYPYPYGAEGQYQYPPNPSAEQGGGTPTGPPEGEETAQLPPAPAPSANYPPPGQHQHAPPTQVNHPAASQSSPPGGQESPKQNSPRQEAAQPSAAKKDAQKEQGGKRPDRQTQGTGRHPTQQDVDPDSIPLMDELPDIL